MKRMRCDHQSNGAHKYSIDTALTMRMNLREKKTASNYTTLIMFDIFFIHKSLGLSLNGTRAHKNTHTLL